MKSLQALRRTIFDNGAVHAGGLDTTANDSAFQVVEAAVLSNP